MSSLAVGRGLEGLELWLAGLFSAAELAAADLLLQLSAAKGIADNDDEAASSSPSPRSATPRSDSEDLTAQEEEEEERAVEQPAVSAELDRRARKRYRLLSDLYAATSPVTPDASAAAKKKRKRRHHQDGHGSSSESSEESSAPTRYGGEY